MGPSDSLSIIFVGPESCEGFFQIKTHPKSPNFVEFQPISIRAGYNTSEAVTTQFTNELKEVTIKAGTVAWNFREPKGLYGCQPKNRGILPPKWMVYFMENPIKMDHLGLPLFLETPI